MTMDLEELKRLARNATPGAWTVQTGNSWRRIGSSGDGDVLCPAKHPHDGWPDLAGPMGNLQYIAAANPDAVLGLISTIESLQAKVAELEKEREDFLVGARETMAITGRRIRELEGEGWVAMHERLPKAWDRVLVTGKATSGAWLGVHMGVMDGANEWHFADADEGGCNPCITDNVTHWRPLPAPPAELQFKDVA